MIASPIILTKAEMNSAVTCPLAGGEVVYFSNRSPDKAGASNEDTLAIVPLADSVGVLALADGCGGEVRGQEAAALAIHAIVSSLKQYTPGSSVRAAILDGFELATRQVSELGGGAATTLIVVEIQGAELRIYNVGDSQAMLVGGRGKIKFITMAHSPVSFAQEAGYLTEDEAIGHADRNIISNALGAEGTYIDVGLPRQLAARDTLVIGSDGLYDNLTLAEIAQLTRKGSITDAVEQTRQRVQLRMSGQVDQPCKPDDFSIMLFRPTRKVISSAALRERAG
jgi:serine/threonine protein phosphatase PrpC